MHEEMVGFIIETPLTKNEVGTGVLNPGDHIGEVVTFQISEFLIIFSSLDFETVLGLWLWGLEGAGQDHTLDIFDFLGHLAMREFFVNDNSFNELRVFDRASGLSDNFDEIKVDIFTLNIGDVENRSQGEVSEVVLTLTNNLGTERGGGTLSQVRVVVLLDV